MGKYEVLKIENQLCFPLYACSKEIVRRYTPFLDKLDLTYTQYIVMMVLWEYGKVDVTQLGQCLFLDSGTLTPVLKKLEAKGLITRERSAEDERKVSVAPTANGMALREDAVKIPEKMRCCVNLTDEEIGTLYGLLYKMLGRGPAAE